MVEALALDFDGVVVDSMPLQKEAWEQTASLVLGSSPEALQLRDALIRNLSAGRAGRRMFESIDLSRQLQDRLRQVKDHIWQELRTEVRLREGAREVLPEAAKRFPLAIATTADRDYVAGILEREGLLGLFRLIVTDADLHRGKPAPQMLYKIGESLSIEPERLLLVGDTPTDLEMARAAGAPCVLLDSQNRPVEDAPDEYRYADAIVDTWEDLWQLLTDTIPLDERVAG